MPLIRLQSADFSNMVCAMQDTFVKPEPAASHPANGVQPHVAAGGQPNGTVIPSGGTAAGAHVPASHGPGAESKPPLANGGPAAPDPATHPVKPEGAYTLRELNCTMQTDAIA